jgi:vacuolar protein-sorting-associated protein 4
MDISRFYDAAKAAADEAVAADKAGKKDEAYNAYCTAVDSIIAGVRFDKYPARKSMYEERAAKYLERIEQLKKEMEGGPKVSGAGGGAATAAKGSGADTGSDDAEAAKMRASLGNAIVAEKPNVKWDDVAGLEGAKESLKEAVILPAKFPQLFTGKRKPWRGILLYGPPGTGKSFLAQAVATEADSCFLSVSPADLVSKWQGDSEK